MPPVPAPIQGRTTARLPQELYGALDVRPTATGGIEFVVPLSPWASAVNWMHYSPYRWIVGVPLTFLVLLGDRVAPVVELRLVLAVGTYVVLKWLLTWYLYLEALFTEERFIQTLEIRPDGLTVNGTLFFDRRHIHTWECWRKELDADGKETSDTVCTFEIQYGIRKIIVLEDIDHDAAPLIAKWFEDTTRRVWAREN